MLQTFNPRNADILVNINGELVHRDRAGVSPFDSSVQNGDAVWEGLRLYDGRIFRLEQHLDRLCKSASMLQYQGVPTREHIKSELWRTLDANRMRDGVHIRLTLSRGLKYTSGLDPRVNVGRCALFILAEHKAPVYDKAGLRLITAQHRRPPTDVLNQHIHACNQLTSILAKMEANSAGADDALMLDTRGCLAETNATHIFIVDSGVVHTSTTVACPEGITRAAVLELCARNGIESRERDITPDELAAADEMFCTGTMGELAPVTELDGRPVGEGTIGPITRRLSDAYQVLVRTEGEAFI
ncbi:MAG: aminotransferase class IV [Phycisphaerales bacterium]